MAQAAMACSGVRAQWGSSVTGLSSRPKSSAAASRVAAPGGIVCGRSKKAKDEKAAAKKEGKKAPVVSKQAKDAARKKAAAAMRDVVARQGKAYDRVVREMDRDQYREYVLSVRHAPPAGEAPEPTLSDWLPICEVVVADKQAYEAQKFFKENDMHIPETEQLSASAEQIEGVPAIRSKLPSLGEEVVGMAFAMAGSKVKDVPMDQLEFGVEDWGSFEVAVSGLEAQAGTKVRMAAAAKVLGVSVDDDPGDVKRVYRKLIATEHPDRNPDASIEKFNAIKEAYEFMSDRGGQSGATFEGLGDKAKRDFVKLEGVKVGGDGKAGEDSKKVEVQLRSLTIYARIQNIFTARNVSLQSRSPTTAAPKPTEPAAEEEATKEPVAA